jgi:hypothetical protein
MKYRFQSILITCLCLSAFSTHAQLKQHPHFITPLSDSAAVNPNEVSIAINPTNKNNIAAVSMQYKMQEGQRLVTNFAYWSADGGKTFSTVAHPNPEQRTQGDDAITFDGDGTAYHSFISFRGLRQPFPEDAINGILVNKSEDGGKSWTDPVAAVDHINTVMPFEDKSWLVTDNTQSTHRGNLYVSWTRFDVYGSSSPRDSTHIYFSRSTNGGERFSQPIRISDKGGNAIDDGNTVEGAVPAVGKNGDVYVVWSGPRGIEMDRSTDGGRTFGKDRFITEHPGGWDIEIPGIGRANGMPVTEVDLSDGDFGGSIYVNWVDNRNGDYDVFCISSRDGGLVWSEVVRVNNDPISNGKDQFFTWMGVDPIDGSVNIAFYDRRDSEGNETGLTLARSTDGGKSFINYKIKQPLFDTDYRRFFGDYLGVDAFDGRVAVAYQYFRDDGNLSLNAAIFDFE